MPVKLRTVTTFVPRKKFHSVVRVLLGIFLLSFALVSLFSKTGIETPEFAFPDFLKIDVTKSRSTPIPVPKSRSKSAPVPVPGSMSRSRSSVMKGSLDSSSISSSENQNQSLWTNGIHMNIAVVVCGSLDYVKTMMKTSLVYSQDAGRVNFIFFADQDTMPNLQEYLIELQAAKKSFSVVNVTYELHDTWFPNSKNIDWLDTNLQCTNQRLFFPSLLPHIDSLIYLDTDVIITGNLSELWSEFSRMNSDQIIAMAPDYDWTYPGGRRFKNYVNNSGIHGVNAGISLMNLTRLRTFDFERKIKQVVQEHRKEIEHADQDMMNILFHENPNQIYILSCIFNFFAPRCTKDLWCEESRDKGIYLVHAAGGLFFPDPDVVYTFTEHDTNKAPAFFTWIYNVTQAFELSESPWKLRNQLITEYEEKSSKSCYGNNAEILTRNMDKYLTNLNPMTFFNETVI